MAAEIARVLRPGGRAVARRLGEPAAQPLDDRRRPGGARARAHRAARPQRARARSGLRTPSGSGDVVLAGGLEIERLEEVPVTLARARRSTSGGRRAATRRRMLALLLADVSTAEAQAPCAQARSDHLQEYVAAGRLARGSRGRARRRSPTPARAAASEDRLAERARDELDGGQRRRVLAVEDRVRLDDLERARDARTRR